MANPNIVATTAIYGKTDVLKAGTSPATITANASESGKVLKVNTLIVATTSQQDAVVTADIYRDSATASFAIATSLTVPSGSSIALLAKENPIYLNEGDAIRLSATASGVADAICSYEEIA